MPSSQWRQLAEQAFAHAMKLTDDKAKSVMLANASGYHTLADKAEAAAKVHGDLGGKSTLPKE